ncbi:MAG: ubiquinone biosynthesis accessory factor UbiJ [Cellvibrionaceae bacterium]
MIDPTISAAATASLEATINKALQYDPATKQKLHALAGKSLALEVTEFKLLLCVCFDADMVRLSSNGDGATTRLVGSLPGLINLAVGDRINLADSDVQAWGNTALLADVKIIASDLELDWEEAINDWLGDVLGHQIAEKLRLQFGWLKKRGQTGKRLLSEFITEELRAVPSEPELTFFSEQIDHLRLATDRIGARVDRLKQKLAPQKPQA